MKTRTPEAATVAALYAVYQQAAPRLTDIEVMLPCLAATWQRFAPVVSLAPEEIQEGLDVLVNKSRETIEALIATVNDYHNVAKEAFAGLDKVPAFPQREEEGIGQLE